MRLPAAALVLALTACGYTPPAGTDVSKPSYRADLTACRDSAASEVNFRNSKTGLAWIASPVRRWGQIKEATQVCMTKKGYRGPNAS
jgi:hypothetical protein